MIVHILAGGPLDHHPDFAQYEDEQVVWAATDRGVYYLLKRGIVPDAAFGDYDSVTDEELEWMRRQKHDLHIMPKEKDETDLELALRWALEQCPDSIRIFGATGGRLDHAFANVQMLVRGIDQGIPMTIIDHKNEISIQTPGIYIIESNELFPYISFLPMTETVTGIALSGFKYPLENETIRWGSTLCVSNELVEEKGTFSFQSGILMVVRSRD